MKAQAPVGGKRGGQPPPVSDPLVASTDATGAKTGKGPKIIKVRPDPEDVTGSVAVRDPSK